jgi:hypothetical protein
MIIFDKGGNANSYNKDKQVNKRSLQGKQNFSDTIHNDKPINPGPGLKS